MTAAFLLLVVLAAVLQLISRKYALHKLDYDFNVDKQLVECGEKFHMNTVLTNGKMIPVFFLHISERVSGEINVTTEGTGVTRRYQEFGELEDSLEHTVYLMPRQRMTRALEASVSERGWYFFRTAYISVGDLLGLKEQSRQIIRKTEIVVMPKKADLSGVESAFGGYLGDISVRRFILSDPILTVGFREYTGREPQRDISWPRSMRDNRLMVKQYDHTAEMTASVLLNINSGSENVIERCYSAARSVCETLEEKHISYSFFTNACTANATGVWSYIGDGIGRQHLRTILDGLGRATYQSMFSFEKLMSTAGKNDKRSRGYILITPKLGAAGLEKVYAFEARVDQKVFLVEIADEEAEQ